MLLLLTICLKHFETMTYAVTPSSTTLFSFFCMEHSSHERGGPLDQAMTSVVTVLFALCGSQPNLSNELVHARQVLWGVGSPFGFSAPPPPPSDVNIPVPRPPPDVGIPVPPPPPRSAAITDATGSSHDHMRQAAGKAAGMQPTQPGYPPPPRTHAKPVGRQPAPFAKPVASKPRPMMHKIIKPNIIPKATPKIMPKATQVGPADLQTQLEEEHSVEDHEFDEGRATHESSLSSSELADDSDGSQSGHVDDNDGRRPLKDGRRSHKDGRRSHKDGSQSGSADDDDGRRSHKDGRRSHKRRRQRKRFDSSSRSPKKRRRRRVA
jgi:hypothetical protein